MRKGARVAIILAGAVALAAAGFWLMGGDVSAATQGKSGGIQHREALVALLTLGIIAIALYGFDLRDWI